MRSHEKREKRSKLVKRWSTRSKKTGVKTSQLRSGELKRAGAPIQNYTSIPVENIEMKENNLTKDLPEIFGPNTVPKSVNGLRGGSKTGI